MPQGNYIVIEGLEGAGKTTAIQTVARILAGRGIVNPIITREPGGTPVAECIRQLIKQGVAGELLNHKAELLMFYAARVQLVENVIKPALGEGKWVIGDRHDLSTQAYQGGGRQLDPEFIVALKQMVLGDFKPDLTLYLNVSPSVGLKRAKQRGELDHIEQESLAFFSRTQARYLQLANADNRIILIDAEKPLGAVTQQIDLVLTDWLNKNDTII